MKTEARQQKRFAVFSGLLGVCFWAIIALFIFLVSKEDITAPFTNFDLYETTSGKIVYSNTVYKSGLGGSWHFDIKYNYRVSGKEYISSKVHFLNTGESLSDDYAQSYVTKYPVGKVITVYFDPNNPSKSVLEPEKRSYSALLFIVCMIAMSFVFLFFSIRLFLRKEQS